MSIRISKNALRLRDKTTGEMKPVSIFSSGADKAIADIANYAESTKTETNAIIEAKKNETNNAIEAKKNEALAQIPENYTELNNRVDELKDDLVQLAYGETTVIPTLIDKGFVRANDGTLGTFSDTTYARTGYICIPSDTYYLEFKAHFNASTGYAFYDARKKYISGSNAQTSDDVHSFAELPTNAVYIAFTDFNVNSDHSKVYITIKCGEANKKLEGIESVSIAIETAKNSAVNSAVSQSKEYTDVENEKNAKYLIEYAVNNMCTKNMISSSFPVITSALNATNISDGSFTVDGTSTSNYPNIKFNLPIITGHKYLFACSIKEARDIQQNWELLARYGGTGISAETRVRVLNLGELNKDGTALDYIRIASSFTTLNSDYDSLDFTISGELISTNKEAAISVKDIVICDVTDLTDDQILEIANYGYFKTRIKTGKLIADGLTEDGILDLAREIGSSNYWKDKKILVLGDSTSAGEVWQRRLETNLGAVVSTHALGGIGLLQMVQGSDGFNTEYDPDTEAEGTLNPLYIRDVYDKDLIIVFGGFNNRSTLQGNVGDLYKDDGSGQKTVAGCLQYVINWIYNKLQGGTDASGTYSANLDCRILIIPPYCCGKYSWIDADGYDIYPGGTQTLHTLANTMIDVANANNCESWNAWEKSGIGRFTWAIWSNSATPTRTPTGTETAPYPSNADQLHLNATGYAHLGDCISAVVSNIR